MAQPTVILVEGDEVFAEELQEFLGAHGVGTIRLNSIDRLIDEVIRYRPDILLLNQFCRGQDCIPCLPELRNNFTGGIVVLTGNQDVTDRIVALETGADDFVLKSVGARELLARLRSLLRRMHLSPGPDVSAPEGGSSAGSWLMDIRHQEFRVPDGSRVSLTPAEFETLRFLAAHSGELVTRDELSLLILKRPFTPLDRSVDNLISRLRRAIELHLPGERVIRSIRGRGYIFMGPKFIEAAPALGGIPGGVESSVS